MSREESYPNQEELRYLTSYCITNEVLNSHTDFWTEMGGWKWCEELQKGLNAIYKFADSTREDNMSIYNLMFVENKITTAN